MIKILYLVSTLEKTGPTKQLSYIIKYLDRRNYHPVILTLSPEPSNSFWHFFSNSINVELHSLNLSRLNGLFFAKRMVKEFILENNICIVHSQGIRADNIMSSIGKDVCYKVMTLRNYPYFDYCINYGKLFGFIMADRHISYLKKADKSFVVSKSVSELIRKKTGCLFDYIRNGIDVDIFNRNIYDKNILRKKFGIPEKVKVFISVGNLSYGKDPLTIIRAFNELDSCKYTLIILGDGVLKNECQKAIKNKNRKLIGKVDNVLDYLMASDFFITASLSEGMPNSVMEAMLCGLPCVLSDILPHIEINEINKKSSVLFGVGNHLSLLKSINKILDNDYSIMSEAAQDIVYHYLNAKYMSQKYQDTYSDLLWGKK